MAKLLSGTRIYGSATIDTQLFISGTNLSTSTTTGALQVIGGVGVGGGIYVSGVITATNTTNASSTITGALQVVGGVGIGGNLYVGGTIFGAHTGVSTTATNLSGSLPGSIPIQSANGVTAYIATGTNGYVLTWSGSTATWSAVSGLTAGSATTATNLAGGVAGQLPYQTAPGVTSFVSTGTAGNVLVSNGSSAPSYNNTLTLTGTLASTSTNTGALQVWGGVGVGGNLNVGGTTSSFAGSVGIGTLTPIWKVDTNLGTIASGSISTGGYNVTGDALGQVGYTTYNMQLNNTTANASGYMRLARTASTVYLGMQIGSQSRDGIAFLTGASSPAEQVRISATGIVTVLTTTNATSTTTGALQVVGGVGVGGDLFIQGDIATNDITFNLINSTATTVNFAGAATTINMGASNSGTTNVRNNLVISGNLTVQGTTTIVDSTVTNIADPILTLGGPANNAAPTADDNKDRGIAFKYLNNAASTSTGFFGYKDSTGYFTYIATATITNEVVSGTKGALDINLAGGSAMALVYQTGTDSTSFLAAGTAGYYLQTNGTGSAPSWVPVSGTTVGTSTQVQTVLQTANATYFPTFVDSNNASATAETVYTTSSFAINPSTGVITLSVRADASTSATTWGVFYNPTTKELTTSTANSGSSTGTTSTFIINNSTAANSTNSGALQVINGGAGIGGNIYAGGDIFSRGTKVIPLNIQEFTATAGQITFTVSGGYTVGTVQVFANGINLDSTDFAASNGTTVVVAEPRAVNDRIKIISGGSSTSVNNIQNFSIAMSVALSM